MSSTEPESARLDPHDDGWADADARQDNGGSQDPSVLASPAADGQPPHHVPASDANGHSSNAAADRWPWDDPVQSPSNNHWDSDGDLPEHGTADAAGATAVAPMFAGEAEQIPEATVLSSRKRHGRTVARELVETLLLALLVFLAVRASFQNFKVDGQSMSPTLHHGEFLIVNKLVYSEVDVEKIGRFLPFFDSGESDTRYVFHGPERGDIIVFRDPRQPEVDLIKRVIGLPGETVEIYNGVVFINGRMLEEPYIDHPWSYTAATPFVIGEDEYFVMGDNRDNSKDSRTVGAIPKDLIIGKAMLTYWPASDFGLAPNEAGTITDKTIEAYREEHARAAAAR